jgi:AcrR family transcriptional regulator
MTKIERLARLLDQFRRRESLSVREISEVCQVSPRTVYRYVKELEKLRIPIARDGGYHVLAGQLDLNTNLDRDALTVLAFCMGHSRLLEYPFFADRLTRIRRVVAAQAKKLPEGQLSDLLELGPTSTSVSRIRENKMLEQFAGAKRKRRKVYVNRAAQVGSAQSLVPLHISIAREGIVLVVARSPRARKTQIDLREVLDIKISREGY